MLHRPWGPSIKSMEQYDKASQQAGFLCFRRSFWRCRVFLCCRWHDHVCHIFHRPPEVFLILAAFNFYLDGTRYTWKMWTDVVAVVILATIHLIRAILHPTQILMPLIFALGFFGLWVLLLDLKTVDAPFFCASCSSLFSNLFWWRLCSRVVPWRNYHSVQILAVARSNLLSWNIQTWHTYDWNYLDIRCSWWHCSTLVAMMTFQSAFCQFFLLTGMVCRSLGQKV